MLFVCSGEEDATPAIAKDEDLSSEEDTGPPPKPVLPEPQPVVKQEKPVRPAVQLKSAKEVELTESEEEPEEEEQTVPRLATTNKQKQLEMFWGGVEEEKQKPKAKSEGLLLDWTKLDPEQQPAKASKKKESPDLSKERAERHKKKAKKSSKKKENEAAAVTDGATVSSPSAATNDPFTISSLDAWLNSEVS